MHAASATLEPRRTRTVSEKPLRVAAASEQQASGGGGNRTRRNPNPQEPRSARRLQMAALVRSGARRLPASALLHPPSPGGLLHRPSPGGLLPRTQVAGISSERKLAEELIFLKNSEIAMLESLEFKLPSPPASDIPPTKKPAPVSTDSVKNIAVLVGGVAIFSGIGWFVMSGTEGGQEQKGECLKLKGEYLKEKGECLKVKGPEHPQKHKSDPCEGKKPVVQQVEDNGPMAP